MDFERSLQQLEEIVKKLEEGELTLEQSLEFFQEGIKLSQKCSQILDKAEQKVQILLKEKDGEVTVHDFHTDIREED